MRSRSYAMQAPNLPHFTPTPSYTASGPCVHAPQQMRFPIDSKAADMCQGVFNIEEEEVVYTSRLVVCVCVSVCVWGGGRLCPHVDGEKHKRLKKNILLMFVYQDSTKPCTFSA